MLSDDYILCHNNKVITCRSTRKRKLEHLTKCSTIKAVNLNQAAEDNNDEALPLQIKDKDCVALEVKYHNSCYRDYTRYLTKQPTTGKGDASYPEAFDVFSQTVKSRIIDNKEIRRLRKLNDMFIKQVNISH